MIKGSVSKFSECQGCRNNEFEYNNQSKSFMSDSARTTLCDNCHKASNFSKLRKDDADTLSEWIDCIYKQRTPVKL